MANIETLLVPKHLGSPDGGNQQSDHRINAGKCSFPGKLKTISFILSEVTPKKHNLLPKMLRAFQRKGLLRRSSIFTSSTSRMGPRCGLVFYARFCHLNCSTQSMLKIVFVAVKLMFIFAKRIV